MSKEGFEIISKLLIFTGALAAGAVVTSFTPFTVLSIVSAIFTGFVVYFFRDPEREISQIPEAIISPADGRVIEIKDEYENEYLKEPSTRVSIFLSVFDVHVNRIPMTGKVGYFRYQKGSFVKAYKKEASDVNEKTVIGIENTHTKILFKQIAGILARRIICNVREGQEVTSGERFGIIKFGSRVDIFLPHKYKINVQLKQKVKGGLSIIGVLNHDS